MLIWIFAVLLSFAKISSSSPLIARDAQVTFDSLPASKELNWLPCYDIFQCAKLDLPLDPDDPSEDLRVSIPLLKYAANLTSDGQYAGMMLFNPGGPGSPGTSFLPGKETILAEVFGPTWDIVTFDTRGTGFASPSTNCSNESTTGTSQAPLSRRAAGLIAPTEIELYFQQELEVAYTIGAQCNATIGANSSSIGHYVSTYYTVRDMLAIVDAYSKSPAAANVTDAGLVHYYGLSAGTIIGQTLASEFPEKLGRVILDGVVDPNDYVSGKDMTSIYLEDEIFEQFLRLCQLAGPTKCAFAQDTDEPLFNRFETLIGKLDPVVASANAWANASDIATALALIQGSLGGFSFFPIASYPALGSLLAAVEPIILHNFSISALESVFANVSGTASIFTQAQPAITFRTEWETSILCSDADFVFGQNVSTSDGDLLTLRNQSYLGGDSEYAAHHVQCAGWPIVAHKRFRGPFGSFAKNCTCHKGGSCNPIQFVGITLDYATPLANAVSSSALFEGSKVIAIDSIGHTGISAFNQCSLKAIQQYLITGQPLQIFCPLETVPFNITTLSEYGWVKDGKLASNQTRIYGNSEGEGPLISTKFNQTG
ncbi:hypothetical protein P7C73_g2477, partial [Tremellales sp. Uapishka_1]